MAAPKGHVKWGGRKAGVPNKRTAAREREVERIIAAATAGLLLPEAATLLPLEAMLVAMRRAYQDNDYASMVTVAVLAAPYVHPRLSSSDVRITNTDDSKSETEVEAELAALRAKRALATKVLN